MADTPHETAFPAHAPRVPTEFRASLLQIPIFDDEALRFTLTNIHPTVAAIVRINGRLWSDRERAIKVWELEVPVPAASTATRNFILERGALFTIQMFALSATGLALGDVWTQAQLVKGFTGSLTGAGILLQGYASQDSRLAWPGSPVVDLHSSKGRIRLIAWTQVTPTLLRVTVPTARRWRVITGLALAATSALVGARNVECLVTAGGAFCFGSTSDPAQGAGLGNEYTIAPGMVPQGTALLTFNLVPFAPDLELRGGDVLELQINAALAGDALTGSGVLVREWFDP